jgi:hypothetical protein
MRNNMGGDTRINGKKAWTTPVMGVIQLNSAQNGPSPNKDSAISTRKS